MHGSRFRSSRNRLHGGPCARLCADREFIFALESVPARTAEVGEKMKLAAEILTVVRIFDGGLGMLTESLPHPPRARGTLERI